MRCFHCYFYSPQDWLKRNSRFPSVNWRSMELGRTLTPGRRSGTSPVIGISSNWFIELAAHYAMDFCAPGRGATPSPMVSPSALIRCLGCRKYFARYRVLRRLVRSRYRGTHSFGSPDDLSVFGVRPHVTCSV